MGVFDEDELSLFEILLIQNGTLMEDTKWGQAKDLQTREWQSRYTKAGSHWRCCDPR